MTEEVLNVILKQYSQYHKRAKELETCALFPSEDERAELLDCYQSCLVLLKVLEPFNYTIVVYNGVCEIVRCY